MASRSSRARRPDPHRADLPGDERTDARERALLVLYESHSKGISPRAVLASQVLRADELTRDLVEGVEDHRQQIDDAISKLITVAI